MIPRFRDSEKPASRAAQRPPTQVRPHRNREPTTTFTRFAPGSRPVRCWFASGCLRARTPGVGRTASVFRLSQEFDMAGPDGSISIDHGSIEAQARNLGDLKNELENAVQTTSGQ